MAWKYKCYIGYTIYITLIVRILDMKIKKKLFYNLKIIIKKEK